MISGTNNTKTKKQKKQESSFITRSISEPVRSLNELSDEEEDDDFSDYVGSQDKITLGETFFQNIGGSLFKYVKKLNESFNRTSIPLVAANTRQKFHRPLSSFKMIFRLLAYQGHQKKILLFAYTSLICTSIAQTKMPQLITQIVDATIVDHDYEKMISYVQFCGLFALFFSVSEFFWGHFFNVLANGVKSDLQLQVFSSLVQREIEFFDKRTIQDILRIFNHQINSTTGICTHKFSSIARNTIQPFLQCLDAGFHFLQTSYFLNYNYPDIFVINCGI